MEVKVGAPRCGVPAPCRRGTGASPSDQFVALALQRHFESFPFFEFFKATFTMGLVGLVVALLMIAHEFQNVLRLPFWIGQTPFD